MAYGTADEALLTVLEVFRVAVLVAENRFMGNLAQNEIFQIVTSLIAKILLLLLKSK